MKTEYFKLDLKNWNPEFMAEVKLKFENQEMSKNRF